MRLARKFSLVMLVIFHALLARGDTNAPAFRFHPELADMSRSIATPIVLTNSPLLGMPITEASNHFAKVGFHWTTNNVAVADTGFRRFPKRSDYIWHRRFMFTFSHGKISKVEAVDRIGGHVTIKEREP